MKKEYFYAIGAFVILLFISIFLIGGMNAKALDNETEKTTDTTTEENVNDNDTLSTNDDTLSTNDDGDTSTTTTTEDDDEAAFLEMFDNFCDKWLMPIIALFSGAAGSAFVTFILKKMYEKLYDKITKAADKTEEEKQASIAELDKTKAALEEYATKFQDAIANVTSVQELAENLIEMLKDKDNQLSLFKDVFILLVKGSKELQSNGTATKILELLEDTNTTTEETTTTETDKE